MREKAARKAANTMNLASSADSFALGLATKSHQMYVRRNTNNRVSKRGTFRRPEMLFLDVL